MAKDDDKDQKDQKVDTKVQNPPTGHQGQVPPGSPPPSKVNQAGTTGSTEAAGADLALGNLPPGVPADKKHEYRQALENKGDTTTGTDQQAVVKLLKGEDFDLKDAAVASVQSKREEEQANEAAIKAKGGGDKK